MQSTRIIEKMTRKPKNNEFREKRMNRDRSNRDVKRGYFG